MDHASSYIQHAIDKLSAMILVRLHSTACNAYAYVYWYFVRTQVNARGTGYPGSI